MVPDWFVVKLTILRCACQISNLVRYANADPFNAFGGQ